MLQAFEFCESNTDFAAVIEGFSASGGVVEAAIALQPDQPRRQQLRTWWEQLSQSGESSGAELAHQNQAIGVASEVVVSAAALLREAIEHGVDTIRAVLGRWEIAQRWEAITRLEENSTEDMQQLMAIEPNWFELCDA